MSFVVGDAEQVVEANDAFLHLLSYTREDLLAGRLRWSTLMAPAYLAGLERAVEEMLCRGFCAPIVCLHRRQDGSCVPILMRLALMEREPLRYVGFVYELTETDRVEGECEVTRANERALREIERCKEEFLGVLSHELRTPLACLRGYMELLAQRFNTWKPQEDSVEDLAENVAMAHIAVTDTANSVSRMSQLVEDLLDAARIREGRLDLCLRSCELGPIVEQAVEEQHLRAVSRVIRLELPTAQAAPIFADALRIRQVVTTFLTNALKYSQEQLPVTVRLEVEGDRARVCVHDEGPPIPLADQAQIWERFHTATGVTVQSGSGVSLGLGLHISKHIVERHHGQVGVSSAPGQGTTFWFALPLAAAHSPAA